MDAITESTAGFGRPGSVGAEGNQDIDASVGEGPNAGGQVLMPEHDYGAMRQVIQGRPMHAQGAQPKAAQAQEQAVHGKVYSAPGATAGSMIRTEVKLYTAGWEANWRRKFRRRNSLRCSSQYFG